jgi:hypothetical protein
MTIPHPPRTRGVKPIKTTIRLSPDLHAKLSADAEANRRSINDELIARIHGSQVATLRDDVAELKTMIREVLDLARDKA